MDVFLEEAGAIPYDALHLDMAQLSGAKSLLHDQVAAHKQFEQHVHVQAHCGELARHRMIVACHRMVVVYRAVVPFDGPAGQTVHALKNSNGP